MAKLLPRDLHISGNVGVDLLVASLEAGRARLLAARETRLEASHVARMLPGEGPQDLREVEEEGRKNSDSNGVDGIREGR